MKHAAVKPEPEVIADPKGTAVNAALPLQSPPRLVLSHEAQEPNRSQSLDVVSTRIQGDWQWRVQENSFGMSGTKGLCVNTVERKCDHWRMVRVAIIVRIACGQNTWTKSPVTAHHAAAR